MISIFVSKWTLITKSYVHVLYFENLQFLRVYILIDIISSMSKFLMHVLIYVLYSSGMKLFFCLRIITR